MFPKENKLQTSTFDVTNKILKTLDENVNVTNWFLRFEIFCRLNKIPQELWTQYVLLSLSDDIYTRVISSDISEDTNYNELKQFLLERYDDERTLYLIQNNFASLKQGLNENLRSFADRVLDVGSKAYVGCPDKLLNLTLTNQFVKGIINSEIKNYLLSTNMENFDQTLQAGRRIELSILQRNNLLEDTENNNFTNKYEDFDKKLDNLESMVESLAEKISITEDNLKKQLITSKKCQKKEHFEKDYDLNQKKGSKNYKCGFSCTFNLENNLIYLNVTINKNKMLGLVDTGSEKTFISLDIVKKLNKNIISEECYAVMANGYSVKIYGKIYLNLETCYGNTNMNVYVMEMKSEVLILGIDFLKALNIQLDLSNMSVIPKNNIKSSKKKKIKRRN